MLSVLILLFMKKEEAKLNKKAILAIIGSGFFSNVEGLQRMLFGFGIGGFERVGVLYGVSGTVDLSFWWARFFEGGVLGVLLPALFLFFLLQNCFSALPHDPKMQSAVAPASGISMVAGASLLFALTDVWRDPAGMLLFFLLCAILTADARHRRILHVRPEIVAQGPTFAEMEFRAGRVRRKHKNASMEDVVNESKQN